MVTLTRKENDINTKKRLLSSPGRYIKCNVKSIYRKLVKKDPQKTVKIPNILENEINNVEKLQKKSIDEFKEIVRLRRIKNRDKSTKEGLIICLLKSESSNAERNYMKYFNNNTNYDNDTNDHTYDGKIRDEIDDIRTLLKKIKKNFMK